MWFASNSVVKDLALYFNFNESSLGSLTSAVQFGFIAGTLAYAIFSIADKFKSSFVFGISAFMAAGLNLAVISDANSLYTLIILRFFVGFFLAGIYPVGMKIASDYFSKGLGNALGFLVGALVLGTAFPHLLASMDGKLNWKSVFITTSLLSLFGGLLIALFARHHKPSGKGVKFSLDSIRGVFKIPAFRGAAIGYFGHMWELYSFWAFLPFILKTSSSDLSSLEVSQLSFWTIAIGSAACIISGLLSKKFGVRKIALIALSASLLFCLASPFFIGTSISYLLPILLIWGFVVIADSPLFSTLVAQSAPAEIKGSAITLVNCLGFAFTIVSLQLITFLTNTISVNYVFVFLAVGPVLGLISNYRKVSV